MMLEWINFAYTQACICQESDTYDLSAATYYFYWEPDHEMQTVYAFRSSTWEQLVLKNMVAI